MPGSGKTSLGKRIAAKLGVTFRDLDKEIELRTKHTPADWIREAGEDQFRVIESEVLLELMAEIPCVISCGGGTPCFFDSLQQMLTQGVVFFIEMPAAALVSRILQGGVDRPLTTGSKEEVLSAIQHLLEKRSPYFNQIPNRIDGLKADVHAISEVIRRDFES